MMMSFSREVAGVENRRKFMITVGKRSKYFGVAPSSRVLDAIFPRGNKKKNLGGRNRYVRDLDRKS